MTDDMSPRLGKRIRYLRKKRKLSQEEVAHRAGTTQSYLGKIERGSAAVGIGLLVQIAAALDTDIAEFFHKHEPSDELLESTICDMVKQATTSERRLIFKLVDAMLN